MRNRILPEEKQWSPYAAGVLHSIPADVSFFDEREEGALYPEERTQRLRRAAKSMPFTDCVMGSVLASLLDKSEREFVERHRPDLLIVPAGVSTLAHAKQIRTAHFVFQSDALLEMGMATTEAVRISEPYVTIELSDIPSDGIPIAIGSDESTKPREAPKSSTPIRSEGMRW